MTEEDWNTSLREQNFRRDAFKIFCELHSKRNDTSTLTNGMKNIGRSRKQNFAIGNSGG